MPKDTVAQTPAKLRSFELALWDCRALRTSSDVPGMMEVIANSDYLPGVGAWTREGGIPERISVAELQRHVQTAHRVTIAGQSLAEGRRANPALDAEFWRFPMVWPAQPHIYATLTISRRIKGDWNVLLLVGTSSHRDAGISLENFCAAWGAFLDEIGDALYPSVRPVLQTFTNTNHEILRFPSAVENRRLIIGWRTWFSSTYVDALGRDWLMNLPDYCRPLSDGGIKHGLTSSAVAFAQNWVHLYTSVRAYLDAARVEPAWPRTRRRNRSKRVACN